MLLDPPNKAKGSFAILINNSCYIRNEHLQPKKTGIKMTLISYLKMKKFYRNINTIFNTTSITEYKKIVIALSVLISYYNMYQAPTMK